MNISWHALAAVLSTGGEILDDDEGVPMWHGSVMQYTTRTERRPAAITNEAAYLKWKWRMNLANPATGLDNDALRAGRTYRLSYFVKTKGVVPYKDLGYPLGAGLCLWYAGDRYEKHPSRLMTGDSGWIHQCHVFTPPVDSPNARLQLRLEHSLGTMWVDGVLL